MTGIFSIRVSKLADVAIRIIESEIGQSKEAAESRVVFPTPGVTGA